MMDIVFPSGNEAEFIAMAERLGIASLVFVYTAKKDIPTLSTSFPHTIGLLVEPNKIQHARDIKALAICTASREAIERGADIVFGFETIEPKEHTHYRKSGLNQVLCKLATQKDVHIGFSFSDILENYGQKRAILIGRMMQNITFCQKFKTPMTFASFAREPYQMRAPHDLRAFFETIGVRHL